MSQEPDHRRQKDRGVYPPSVVDIRFRDEKESVEHERDHQPDGGDDEKRYRVPYGGDRLLGQSS